MKPPLKRVFDFKARFDVPIPDQTNTFAQTPLITPERLLSNWFTVFSPKNLPAWVRLIAVANIDDDGNMNLEGAEGGGFPQKVFFAAGTKHPDCFFCPPIEGALILELTRFDSIIVINPNSSKSGGRNYARLLPGGAREDLETARRILFGAVENEATKALGIERDIGSDNTYVERDPRAIKNARSVILQHAVRLANEHQVAGKLPKGFDIGAYVSNIITMFTIIDALLDPVNGDLNGSFVAYMARYRGFE